MRYIPINHKDIKINDEVACVNDQYGTVMTGTVVYTQSSGISIVPQNSYRPTGVSAAQCRFCIKDPAPEIEYYD